MCCDKGSSAPPPDPAIARSLDAQTELANKMYEFTTKSYAENQTRQTDIDKQNSEVSKQAMDIAQKGEDRADDAYKFYTEKGRPLVEQSFADAKDYDSQGNIDSARGRATADVGQAFDNTAQQSQRALSRMGVNPSSGRFLEIQQRLQADKAAALAGAATGAEEGRRSGAIQLRQQASNLASGMPAQSLAQNGQALSAGASASGINTSGMNTALATQGAAMSGLGGAASTYGNVASGYNNLYSNQLQATQMNNQNSQSQMAGLGSLVGVGASLAMPFMADGGKVKGPGTGTSDSVPAVNKDSGQRIQLSNGEYVLSADTVKALSTKYLDNLQAKHHKPVNLGRAA
jgi:hypothetical protein